MLTLANSIMLLHFLNASSMVLFLCILKCNVANIFMMFLHLFDFKSQLFNCIKDTIYLTVRVFFSCQQNLKVLLAMVPEVGLVLKGHRSQLLELLLIQNFSDYQMTFFVLFFIDLTLVEFLGTTVHSLFAGG